MKNIYTDLALEEREKFNRDIQIEGVESYQKKENSVNMLTTVVKIVNEKGKETMGKPIGSYITMESPKIRYSKEAYRRELGKFLCNYLKEITSKENIKSILIVGLGNSMATPDALGPKTARDIICTKNIYCMAPGVLSQTGMETYDIIKGVVSQIDPDLIIAIDSLAARNVRRITTTIQITNTGITPGSGIGNHRKGLNEESLGKKVIAIGVPMVVSGATIVNDTMENLIRILSKIENNPIGNAFKDYTPQEKYQLFEELLSEETEDLFVTPKDVDEIVDNLSKIIAHGINDFCRKVLS